MNGIKNFFFIVICFITTVASAQYITVDDTKSAKELIENTLVNSTCASATNFKVTGDTFSGVQNSYGYFNAGSSNFPLKEGVILSTSSSKTAIGPYVSNQNGGGNKLWLGDADLDQKLGTKSVNATVLEFDFIPLTDFISFNYIFASNEYQSYFPCEYSDGFAFLIKEAGSTDEYKNIAVIPGTNIPVSSKNVHPIINSIVDSQNITHAGCVAINEGYFNGFNTPSSPVNYSGQTIKMTAKSDVIAGKAYHIKLVIADDGAQYYDSAVFLEAGSFSANIDLGPDRTATNNTPICFGENYLIDTKLSANYQYKWYKNGSTTPILGETNPSLTVTEAGTYKVKVTLSPSICTAEDEIKIEYAPQIVLSEATTYRCDPDGDGLSVTDISRGDNIIKNNDPKLTKLMYYKSLSDAQNEINPINSSLYSSHNANETLYARVSNAFGCTNYALLHIVVPNNPISSQNPIESCDTDTTQDGITQFDLNAQITPQLINGLQQGLNVEYYLTENDAVLRKKPLPNLFTNTIPYKQVIYAYIVNGPECFEITPETLVVKTFNPPNFQDVIIGLCDDSNKDLTVDSGFSSYLWSNGDTANTTNVSTAGEYTVTVTNAEGCENTKKYIVKLSEIGIITNATVSDFSGSKNTVTLSYTGSGNYEFSLDGNIYQDSPTFNSLNAGVYLATARDKNGCGTSTPYKVYVLDYPRFFTPNNDGYNDNWNIKGANETFNTSAQIFIYDRYGKLIKQVRSSGDGWDGTYIGSPMPADDYWYTIKLEDGREVKGHFSLKR